MAKSKPWNIVMILYAPVWESEYKETYRGTARDLKEAKDFLAMNETIFDEIPEFQEHATEYLKSKWDGWTELRHPCWGFLRNYNTFAPKKIKRETKQAQTPQMIHCSDCKKYVPVDHDCDMSQIPKHLR